MHIQLSPDINSMLDMVHKVSRNLIVVIQSVPRLSLQLTDRQAREFTSSGRTGPLPCWSSTRPRT
jgi:dynein heavy chain